jgi:hypothetical protein
MHAFGEVHETLSRTFNADALRCGVGSIDHFLPFQDSAKTGPLVPVLFWLFPTAMHVLSEVQDTEDRLLFDPRRGAPSINHVFPFQRSTSGTKPTRSTYQPVAVQALAEVHDTSVKVSPSEAIGLGLRSIVHFAPFQVSASVTLVTLSSSSPTAMHASTEVHDTA